MMMRSPVKKREELESWDYPGAGDKSVRHDSSPYAQTNLEPKEPDSPDSKQPGLDSVVVKPLPPLSLLLCAVPDMLQPT